jgi:hypothetical protein
MSGNSAFRHAVLDAMPNVIPRSAPAFEATTVACYDNQVPAFVDAALDRLYGSIYSTIGMFRFDGSIATANTYVVSANGEPTTVLLYRREGPVITVLNGAIRLSKIDMERFAATVFARYRKVSVIVFNTVQHDVDKSRYPHQRFSHGEDIVADLPKTSDIYFANLGKNMRETIKRFQNRLKRNHPSFRFHVYVNEEADEEQIRELYKLQRARIESKNKQSTVTDSEIERIITLAKTRGLVTIATIDGKVCGGMVCWRAGDNFFMRTIAHDPRYDDAKLGTLCCYYTICECIARGGKAFHFSAGRVLYKYRFLGVERYYDRIVLYRSRVHMFLNAGTALAFAIDGKVREFRLWLNEAKSGDAPKSPAVLALLRAWRAIKEPGSLRSRIAAVKTALRPIDDEAADAALRLSASPEANQEIKARRRAAAPASSAGIREYELDSVRTN